MQFCKDCGGVLNLFGNDTSDLCSSCVQHKKEPEPIRATPPQEGDELLAESILSVKNGKITLSSKEGWQLWSAPMDSKTTLKSMLKSAKLIYKIRSKRKKKP